MCVKEGGEEVACMGGGGELCGGKVGVLCGLGSVALATTPRVPLHDVCGCV